MQEEEHSGKIGLDTEELKKIISANLEKLLSRNNITQKSLAERLEIAPASMTDYCKGRRIPNTEFFIRLKQLYNISIDDFLTGYIDSSAASPSPSGSGSAINSSSAETCRKYCGTYFLYYFDTSKYKGRDTLVPRDSLFYGVLDIYRNSTALELSKYSCAAVLGIGDRDKAAAVKETLAGIKDPLMLLAYINKEYRSTAYYGDFDLSREHAFLTMTHDSTDKALLILHRVDSNKTEYLGGIGTINSISKGREKDPVIQFIGVSRYPLAMSEEEIHHSLLLNYPTFKAEAETEEMIRNFKALYVEEGEAKDTFSEYQKAIVVRSTLERAIRKSLERNMFRYGKITGRDDDEWYHRIKLAGETSPESE